MSEARVSGMSAQPDSRSKSRGKKGDRGGEQLAVPRAEFRSYYGRPVIKESRWREPEVPGYLFLGGLAGASSVLALSAQACGQRELARNAKIAAVGAIGGSAAALISDLGRPSRFYNMLRVFKTSSPMSVGSWLLAGYGPLAGAAAASAVTGWLPRAGAAATAGAAALGSGIATYTAALVCDTATPAWHDAHREMPYLFAGSAAGAAGGLGMLTAPAGQTAQAATFAALGATAEVTAKHLMTRRLGRVAEPYHTGRPGKLLQAAEALTLTGLAGAAATLAGHSLAGHSLAGHSLAGHSLAGSVTRAAGLALIAASALTRFGVFEAGQASARDPGYTVGPQRDRLQARARADV
jgi:formate-dependent nitrite reductase membrane component NrfD